MVICAIFGCSKRSGRDKVSFFRIPGADTKRNLKCSELLLKRKNLWITRIKREDLDEMKIRHARICNLHFISGKPSSLTDVDNPDWAPSINLGHKVENVVSNMERYQRWLQRQKNDDSNQKGDNSDKKNDDEISVSDQDPIDEETTLNDMDVDSSILPTTSQAKVDAATCTELTMERIKHLEEIANDYSALQNDYLSLKQNSNYLNFTNIDTENFNNDAQVNFYTGLINAITLRLVFNFVAPFASITANSKLSKFQEFVLFLMRLRLNLLTQDLGYRFNVSQGTVCRVFNKWLDILYMRLKKIVFWPTRDNLLKTMPDSFKSAFEGHVAVIIDCFEIIINRPTSLEARAATWSNYKQRNTVKYLIGITGQGVVSFISLGWGGRSSDKLITEQCGILDNLIPGDVVLADRGFNNLDSVGFFCAKLVLPASARSKNQLDPVEVESTRKIASLRIHVERVIGQLRKKFRILKGVLPIEMCITADNDVAQIDKIVHVCCALINLMPSVVC